MADLSLIEADPEIAQCIADEERRQHDKLRLIPSENYASRAVLEAYSKIRSMHPRLEGSEGERQLLSFIEQRLEFLRVPYSRLDFSESDQNHSFSSCIVADVAGQREDTLILAVPINHPPEIREQFDGSINVAMALGIIEHISRATPPLSVKILFLGAEYGQTAEYPMGSRLFLRAALEGQNWFDVGTGMNTVGDVGHNTSPQIGDLGLFGFAVGGGLTY